MSENRTLQISVSIDELVDIGLGLAVLAGKNPDDEFLAGLLSRVRALLHNTDWSNG